MKKNVNLKDLVVEVNALVVACVVVVLGFSVVMVELGAVVEVVGVGEVFVVIVLS